MIRNDAEMAVTQERIARFQRQLLHLRATENDLQSYAMSASGFLAEIDRMQLEVREYLSQLPSLTSLAA